MLNKQPRKADKGQSFTLGFGQMAYNFSPWKSIVLRNVTHDLRTWQVLTTR